MFYDADYPDAVNPGFSRNRPSVSSYLLVTHPLNPPPVRGTFVGICKDIRIWNDVSVKSYVIAKKIVRKVILYIGSGSGRANIELFS